MNSDSLSRRRQIFVDGQVQGAVLWRIAVYWFCCLLSITLLQACWIVLTSQPSSSGELFYQIWHQSGPSLIASFILLPIIMLDCVRLTNRFAGPVVRLRRQLRQVANNEPTTRMVLRKGDFWTGLADDYNAAMDRLCAQTPQSQPPSPQHAGESPVRFPVVASTASSSIAEPVGQN